MLSIIDLNTHKKLTGNSYTEEKRWTIVIKCCIKAFESLGCFRVWDFNPDNNTKEITSLNWKTTSDPRDWSYQNFQINFQ